MNTQTKHEESGCTDYLQHTAENCPNMAAPAQAQHKFPLKPYLNLARKVFEDAQGSNDMGVISDLLEAKAHAQRLADLIKEWTEIPSKDWHCKALEALAQWEGSKS